MMFGGEKRRQNRILTYLMAQMTDSRDQRHCYGYIEDICQGGVRIISLDRIEPQTKLYCCFFLGDEGRLNLSGTIIYLRKSMDMIHCYGFQFDKISKQEQRLIEEFMKSTTPTIFGKSKV